MLYDRLGKCAKTTQKIPQKLSSIFVQENQSYGPYKICTVWTVHPVVLSLDFCASFLLYGTQKSIQYDLFSELYSTSIFVPTLMLYDLLNPYSMTCNKCCTFCLEMHASFCLEMCALALQKWPLSSNSNFCSLALSKMFHLPKNGCALLP
jgi:hypothetical protein